MTPQTAEDEREIATPATEVVDDAAVVTEPSFRRERRRKPRVMTLALSLALLLVTAAYIAELRESSDLRWKLQRSQPTTSPSMQPAAK